MSPPHKTMGFPGGAGGKEPTCQCSKHKRQGFHPWVRKIPWGRAWQLTPVFLSEESHGQRSLACYNPLCSKELDMTEATEHTCMAQIKGILHCNLSLVQGSLFLCDLKLSDFSGHDK